MMNRNDAALDSLKQWKRHFALGDAVCDSKNMRQCVGNSNILFLSPIKPRNGEMHKNAYGWGPIFLRIELEK